MLLQRLDHKKFVIQQTFKLLLYIIDTHYVCVHYVNNIILSLCHNRMALR
jgi:hypothetical protein